MSSRPAIAQSRNAWDGNYGNDGIRDDPDLVDSQAFMGGDKNANNNDSPQQTRSTSGSGDARGGGCGCCGMLGRVLRTIWATRQTEETKADRELYVKTTLRELMVYIVFLVVICTITFGMTSTTMYYYTKVMSDLFLDKENDQNGGTFRSLTSVEDLWHYAKGPLVDGLFWEKWYNNRSMSTDEKGYIYYENKLLGVPRIRQIRVSSNSCVVHEDFEHFINQCFDSYSDGIEDKEQFGSFQDKQYTAWRYQTEKELDSSSHWGLLTRYSGSGNIQDLVTNKTGSLDIINYLHKELWIRRGTRAFFVDFTVYNANINLFCVVRLLVEFPATGGAIPSWSFRTVKLIRYVTIRDYFVLACEVIFCLFIFYYTVEEIIEIKTLRLSYFKSVFSILDILVIVISIVCVAFNLYRTVKVGEKLKSLLEDPNAFADFETLSYWETNFSNAIAITTFLAWIKTFKYISFNKTMTQLSSTLGRCAKDLAGFFVMFIIIFLAFTQLGYLLFGSKVKDFSTFQNTFFTLFRIILGDFDFEELETANRILGPIFFMLFVFFVFFVLINMFLAIINDTYSEVKSDMANQKSEFEIADFFKKGYSRITDKLNFKRDKIVDIQKALQSSDIKEDQELDFEEWRKDLKKRGYADGEIEAMFARYDVDCDRMLNADERRRMQADLFEQKAALNNEYEELGGKGTHPGISQQSSSRVSFDESGEESDDEETGNKSFRTGRTSSGVSYEEFIVLSRRVDRMEHSIGSIVSKIDAVLVKLEAMEKAKLKRRETMGKMIDRISESGGMSDEMKREQMEKLVREELERWDSDTSVPQSARGASPADSGPAQFRGGQKGGEGEEVDQFDIESIDDLLTTNT